MPKDIIASNFEQDTLPTSKGNLVITFIGHGSLMLEFCDLVIQVDPTADEADYEIFPKADVVIFTHHHSDHFDPVTLRKIVKNDTRIILTQKCLESIRGMNNTSVMKNGDELDVRGVRIIAVPAYNIQHMRAAGIPFHPKGEGNGYILALGDKRVYIAGDTENTPEMKALKNIDVAFLPMNLPYTMTPQMVADAARTFKPAILYPYHYGSTDTDVLVKLFSDQNDTEVRIRKMK